MTKPSRHEIWKMFDQISSTYDKTNRILSLGLDIRWRKQVAKQMPDINSLKLLDLATGTGDQILSILKYHRKKCIAASGIDLSKEMLKLGRQKIRKTPFKESVHLIEGDAQKIPFEAGSFDVLTMSFGIRNVENLEHAFQEMLRVLTPSGKLIILEFALPKPPVKTFYLLYLRHLLPRIGGLFSKNPFAYQYLNQTIETFPHGKHFCDLLSNAGFSHVKFIPLTFGTVNLYVGYKK